MSTGDPVDDLRALHEAADRTVDEVATLLAERSSFLSADEARARLRATE